MDAAGKGSGSLIGSSEFFAALVGALAAFIFDAWMRWRERVRTEQDAANTALLTLVQMYTHLDTINKQIYEARKKFIQESYDRAPIALEYLPSLAIAEADRRFDLGTLAFLLRTHEPNVANRLAFVEQSYIGNVLAELERSKLQIRAQSRVYEAKPEHGAQTTYNFEQLKAVVGHDLYAQLDSLTSGLVEQVPKCMADILKAGEELNAVVTIHFPTRRFINFKPNPKPEEMVIRKPARWRVLIRACVKAYRRNMFRRPIKLNR